MDFYDDAINLEIQKMNSNLDIISIVHFKIARLK